MNFSGSEMLKWRGVFNGGIEIIEMAEDSCGFMAEMLKWPRVSAFFNA